MSYMQEEDIDNLYVKKAGSEDMQALRREQMEPN